MFREESQIMNQAAIEAEEKKEFSEGANTFDFIPEFNKEVMYLSNGQMLFLSSESDEDEKINHPKNQLLKTSGNRLSPE